MYLVSRFFFLASPVVGAALLTTGCGPDVADHPDGEEVDACTGTVERLVEQIRTTGEPDDITFEIDGSSDRCVTIDAGWQADGPGAEAVPAPSSAWVEVDGQRVFGPENFNGSTWSRSWVIPATEEVHQVSLRTNSKPGTGVRLWVHERADVDLEAEEPEPWSPAPVAHLQHGQTSLTLVHHDGANLTPDERAELSIELVENWENDNPLASDALGIAFDLKPDGAQHSPAMIATLRWPEGALTEEEARHARVFLQDSSTGVWEAAPVLERSVGGRYIRVAVRHHSLLSFGIPNVLEPIKTFVADKAVQFMSNILHLPYGDGPGENRFADYRLDTQGGNSTARYGESTLFGGFMNAATSDEGFSLRNSYDNAMSAVTPYFWHSNLDYSDSWRHPADFNHVLQGGYVDSAGMIFEFVACDTLDDYFDSSLIQAGDAITMDCRPDFVQDRNFVPDGEIDIVLQVERIEPWRPGYDEVRLQYQDHTGYSDIGLGTLNDAYYKRAIFCAWRPYDLRPVGDTVGADPSPIGIFNPVDGFDYPVGPPQIDGGDGVETWANDEADDHYGTLGWLEDYPVIGLDHCGEDWLNNHTTSRDDVGEVPIYAVANGVVRHAGLTEPNGNYGPNGIGPAVTIDHWMPEHPDPRYEVVQSVYWHLWSIEVEPGEEVHKGQRIGTMGNGQTDDPSTATWVKYWPHLHFELRWDETQLPDYERGYGCTADSSGMTDPRAFIDANRAWP